MKAKSAASIGLLILATCSEDFVPRTSSGLESTGRALGKVPPTESAVWQKVGARSGSLPEARYLQAVAFDEARGVVVMFGGIDTRTGDYVPSRETWEWSPKTGKWTDRTGTGAAPDARSGASMAFDSVLGRIILFGGRAASGVNLEDTWEWNPATGVWTNVAAAGNHPAARSQHGMVYEKGARKLLLFGGGRSDTSSIDGTGISASLGDTWEYESATSTWKKLTPAATPTARHDLGLVWDSARSKAVLFGGMQAGTSGAAGTPKQDTWEWDPANSTWTERTAASSKPSPRSAHALAFDGKRGRILLFGGLDANTSGLGDLWELDPTTFVWTQRLTGAESGIPSPRMYASLVSDDTSGLLELLAGLAAYPEQSNRLGATRDVWELAPVTPAFTDRTAPAETPSGPQAMAYNPATGKTYLFGGADPVPMAMGHDLWEWDGKAWALVAVDSRPPARTRAGLAYDPVRQSLILFGGAEYNSQIPYDDTWEFGSDGKWTLLAPARSPDARLGHVMVTDTARGRILLFGGTLKRGPCKTCGPGVLGPAPVTNQVWEWDGAGTTWTNRTPPASAAAPAALTTPLLTYDEGRQKMFLFDYNSGNHLIDYWEWDPITAGWASRSTGDPLADVSTYMVLAYDSIRGRQILLTDLPSSPSDTQLTLEIDTRSQTLFERNPSPAPGCAYGSRMVFDGTRGVVVHYCAQDFDAVTRDETWEYKVTNLGNGEGCTAAFASSCASGFCVEGVCCDVAACTGPCKSCSVAGSEGTCVLAAPGTEVPGSCAEGKACDATGSCKTKNGQTCATAGDCASGFCVDGVCCDSACTGECRSCNQTGRAGKCTPFSAGADPQNECGQGTGLCKSTCDGNGACAYPAANVTCDTCLLCDGTGECTVYDYYYCGFPDGDAGAFGGSGGSVPNLGGSGGSVPNLGGSGGSVTNLGGSSGSIPNLGGGTGGMPGDSGTAGGIPAVGGAGGVVPTGGGADAGVTSQGGAGGGTSRSGGAAGSTPTTGGAAGGVLLIGGSAGGAAGGVLLIGGSAGGIPVANLGGSGGSRDAGMGDAGKASTHKSGCSCALGGKRPFGIGLSVPPLLGGIAIVVLGRRRRRSKPASS